MRPIKVIMFGSRHDHTPDNFIAMKNAPETFDLLGVCLPEGNRAMPVFEGARVFTPEEALAIDDLDAVVIESGKEYEIYDALKFARRGINVFLDKPGSHDVKLFDELLSVVREKSLAFGLGYIYRFNPLVKKAAELRDEGALGKIFSVEAQMSMPHNKAKREWLSRYRGGMMFFLGCHIIDVVCSLQGFPERVVPFDKASGKDGLSSEDTCLAVLEYKDGVSFVKTCASEVNGYARRRIVVCGTGGTLEFNPEVPTGHPANEVYSLLTAKGSLSLSAEAPEVSGNKSGPVETAEFDRYLPMLEQFARQIREKEGYARSLEYESKLLKTVVAACGESERVC